MKLLLTGGTGALVLATLLLGASFLGPAVDPAEGALLSGASRREMASEPDTLLGTGPTLVSEAGHRVSEFMMAEMAGSPIRAATYIDWDAEAATGCSLTLSEDGGASWRPVPIASFSDLWTQGDPWVSFGEDGSLHAICMAREPYQSRRMWYTRSDDLGATWTPRVIVPMIDQAHGIDKNSILVDSRGYVHVCFMESSSGVVHARSRDGGVTWDQTRTVWRQGSFCNGLLEGPGGSIYMLVAALAIPVPIRVMASHDGGDTWTLSNQMDLDMCGLCTPAASAYNPAYSEWAMASLGVSPVSGNVFVTLQTFPQRVGGAVGDRFVAKLYRADAQALAFSEVALPDLPTDCAFCHEMRPSVLVDPVGRLALTIPVEDDHGIEPREIWFLASDDDGETWREPLLVASETFPRTKADPRAFVPSQEGLMWTAERLAEDPAHAEQIVDELSFRTQWPVKQKDGGHYWDFTWNDHGFYVAWIGYHDGIPQVWGQTVG